MAKIEWACPYCGEEQIKADREPVHKREPNRYHGCRVTGKMTPYAPVPEGGFKRKIVKNKNKNEKSKSGAMTSWGFAKSGDPNLGGPR